MPSPRQTLSERHAQLVARCAAERERAAVTMNSVKRALAGADRGLESARRWIRNPVVIAAGIALALAIGRWRSLRAASAALGLLSAGLKARGIVRSMSELQATPTRRP